MSLRRIRGYGSQAASATLRGQLIEGDSLEAMRALRTGQEGPRPQLIYLDPPFNTGEAFTHYRDRFETADWLSLMWDRLVAAHDLLAEEGSIWVHCDDRGQAYLRVMLDEIFGRDGFVATVVWQRRYSRENRRAIGAVHDYLHVFSPIGGRWKEVRNRLAREDPPNHWRNPDDDPRGPWSSVSLVAQGGHGTEQQHYEIVTPSGRVVKPPLDSCWRVTHARFEELVAEGRITFGAGGNNVPRRKVFFSEAKGLAPWTWWTHPEVGHNEEARREQRALFPGQPAFPTPKPERLMARIVEIATNPGDLVLDGFLGSATTAAVAHKLGRAWIGVEVEPALVKEYAIPRMRAVIDGEQGGVSEAAGWSGGGSFDLYRCAPEVGRQGGEQSLALAA
ncbi:MAG TPA: site-specific DNA-methyltransferase [Solirubrobacterales bacterium]|nr:site-specific DNA-methyltransferase [Solirubrobacterales bacterium]